MRFASASQTEGRGLKNRAPVRGGRNSTTNAHLGKDRNVCLFLLSFLIMFFFSLLHLINPAYFSHCISSFSAHWSLSVRCLDPSVHLQSVSSPSLVLWIYYACLTPVPVNVIRLVSSLPGLLSPSSSRGNKKAFLQVTPPFLQFPLNALFPKEIIRRSAHHGFSRSSFIWSCFQEPQFLSITNQRVVLAQQHRNHQGVC